MTVAITSSIQLEPSWLKRLYDEFSKPYMQSLKQFLVSEKRAGHKIFPAGSQYFNAYDYTPFEQVRVVILGQDPYHGPGQAHGLCFSVPPGIEQPPSLVNIFKEIESDLGIAPPAHGCLTHWARQGVLLLNSVLTVTRGQAASHRGRGWEEFTDRSIELLNGEREHVVFMLWGSYAQKKGAFIDRARHLVLEAPHPSPLSAHRGFFGCRHFSKANRYLEANGVAPIDWRLPEQPEL